jgi:hypothetical protein
LVVSKQHDIFAVANRNNEIMNSQTAVLTKPIITLKNAKTFIGREGYGLNATIYVDGIKTAFIMDDAGGGEPDYDIFNQEKFDQVKAWCELQPERPMVYDGEVMKDAEENPLTTKVTIDELVDNAFNASQREKEAQKMIKKMADHVMWGVPGDNRYATVKMNIPLAKIPTDKLQALIDKYKSKFKPGEQFLNTNFEALKIKI